MDTTGFALGLAGGSFGYSFLFARARGHALLFALGAGALALAWGIQWLAAPPGR